MIICMLSPSPGFVKITREGRTIVRPSSSHLFRDLGVQPTAASIACSRSPKIS